MFRAEAHGRRLTLEDAGLLGVNEVFRDIETGSRWQQSSLEAISGPLKGEHLDLYPFLVMSWQEWLRLHPRTLVVKPLPGYAERIPTRSAELRTGYPISKAAPAGLLFRDERLKPYAKVVGLTVGGTNRAYPLDTLARVHVVNEELDGRPVLVVYQPKAAAATAFVASAHRMRLTFDAANADATALIDRETRSRWDAYGTCTSGKLKGTRLETLVLKPEYWFSWAEFHRNTSIFDPSAEKRERR